MKAIRQSAMFDASGRLPSVADKQKFCEESSAAWGRYNTSEKRLKSVHLLLDIVKKFPG